jgi:ABC-2 type transport system ATP-binding protein
MNTNAIEVADLHYRYSRSDAVNGLSLSVEPGKCYGFFGRNGAGKTTTIKCLLNLLRPSSGSVRVFGMDPARSETEVKSRLAYVPDQVAFYPWMSVREALDFAASFRSKWNRDIEAELLGRFGLDPDASVTSLSKGMRTQLALIGAVCPEPDMLLLDEPTSGLDPLVRRDFIRTVIGAYQDAAPGRRTVFVSTHLISEFEGLIDRFTVIDKGRAVLTADADAARADFRRWRAEFAGDPPPVAGVPGVCGVRTTGRTVELTSSASAPAVEAALRERKPLRVESESLSLEEIFITAVSAKEAL